MNFPTKVVLAFATALLLLAAVGALSYQRILQADADQKWVDHTHVVIERLDSVFADLLDQETGQRGYALTRDDSFLQPYYAGLRHLHQHFADLRTLTADNKKRQYALDALEPVISARLALFQNREPGGRRKDRMTAGKQLMDEIRSSLDEMKKDEQALLSQRLAAAETSSRRMKLIIAAGYLMSFLALVLAWAAIHQENTRRLLAEREILRRSAELEAANKELEAFSYSVSHDLRAPLRGIDGFSQALLEDNAAQLDGAGQDHLNRIRAAASRMGALIDDLLKLSRVTRAEIHRETVDLSALAAEIVADLRTSQPERNVTVNIAPGLKTEGDSHLLGIVLHNLISNSWKFTSKRTQAWIELGVQRTNGEIAYFVRDDGAGFDQAHAGRLFGAFQRLHAMNEFPGTGVGLATVQRIIHRHGGRVWGVGAVNKGATIYFTL